MVRQAEREQAEAPGRRRAEPRASWGRRSGRRGGLLSCIGAGLRAGGAGAERGAGAGAVGAGGAAASCAAGGEGADGAEGAAFCAVAARAGVGATAVGPGETGGRTLVWSIQKTAAIATRTTPASKAHNQRDIAFPSRRSELSPSYAKS